MSYQSTVIVIDSDKEMCDSLEWVIRSSGRNVRSYDSGLNFLDDTVHDGRPDCVILDTHLSEITGVDLYGILKTQYPGVPVIFITRFPEQSIGKKARALEAQRFFTKPLNISALLNCLDGAITSSGVH